MPSPVIGKLAWGLGGSVEYPLLAAADIGKAPELRFCLPWASGGIAGARQKQESGTKNTRSAKYKWASDDSSFLQQTLHKGDIRSHDLRKHRVFG